MSSETEQKFVTQRRARNGRVVPGGIDWGMWRDSSGDFDDLHHEVNELREALAWHLDDDPCRYDHHGGCQTHDPNEGTRECMVRQHRRMLAMKDLG